MTEEEETIRLKPPFKQLSWEDIGYDYVVRLIDLGRMEDLQGVGGLPKFSGDVTTAILGERCGAAYSKAMIVAREPLVVCGLPLIPLILKAYGGDACFEPIAQEKAYLKGGDALGVISGSAKVLLQAERLILNFLQRLSGIATLTARYVAELKHTSTRLLDTRKTTPGLRVLEKYAVACGGGWNHRLGLFDHILFKDNHVALKPPEESISKYFKTIVERARERYPELCVEIEVDSEEQIEPALEAGVDIILLDNFSFDALKRAVAFIGVKALTEASGNITFANLKRMADLGLGFISSGAITHKSSWVDISLDWQI